MWFFGKHKKAESEEEKKQKEQEVQAQQKKDTEQKVMMAIYASESKKTSEEDEVRKKEETGEMKVVSPDAKPQESEAKPADEAPAAAPVKEEAKPAEEPKKEEPAAPKKAASKKAPKEEKPKAKGAIGKYEVYPEAGMYKFRLKANNGEILIVSNGYASMDGAINGIDTLKKNLKIDNSRIVTDKAGFSQFKFFTANNGRLIIAGEFYPKADSAQSALESTKKFAFNAKIVKLDKIPPEEEREETVALKDVDKATTGKLEIYQEDGKYYGRLLASNRELLFVTDDYSSRSALLNGLKTIFDKVEKPGDSFHVCRDKQNRYCFKLYSTSGQQLLVGQTYPSKDSALSAIDSVRRFLCDADVIELKDEKK